jgi:hypothetical protein
MYREMLAGLVVLFICYLSSCLSGKEEECKYDTDCPGLEVCRNNKCVNIVSDGGLDSGISGEDVYDGGVSEGDTGDSEVIHRDAGGDSYGCSNPCECNSGEVCSSGECKYWRDTFGPYIFCCTDPECPSLGSCVYPDGKSGLCPEKIEDAGVDVRDIEYKDSSQDIADIIDVSDVKDTGNYDVLDDISSGGLTLSINPSNIPEGHSGGGSYNVVITMSASGGNPPYSFNCSGSGLSGIKTVVSGDKCTISGYTPVSGFYNVVFSVVDANGGRAEISREILFCYDITTTGKLPNYLKNQSADIYRNNVPGAIYYCFTTMESYDIISVNQEAEIDSSGGYSSQIDLYVGENSYVHCPLDGPQNGGGNDTVLICRRDSDNKCIKGQHLISLGSKFFPVVCNYDKNYVAKFRMSWAGYAY